jgi:hypothetical protein
METNFAKRLVVARKMARLSLQQLADKLGNDINRKAFVSTPYVKTFHDEIHRQYVK